jgi:hypothetical protein
MKHGVTRRVRDYVLGSSAALELVVGILAIALAVKPTAGQQVLPTAAGEDETGFESIFDGKSLAGWDGDAAYWRVEDGVLVGEVTPETVLKNNTFVIWRGGKTKDFELKLEYRITAGGNSGVNYRSEPFPSTGEYALKGYQADIDGANKYTGQSYEEKGRTFLALRGDVGRIDPDGKARTIGSVGDSAELAKGIKAPDEWNALHIVARGTVMTHLINGRVMCIVVDDDAAHRKLEGLLGMQVHVGPPMKVEFRNILLKKIE